MQSQGKVIAGKPSHNDKLGQTYQAVRNQFFPAWIGQANGGFAIVPRLRWSQGKCCREQREIRITDLPDGEQGNLLLIHEIAHAIAPNGHGKSGRLG